MLPLQSQQCPYSATLLLLSFVLSFYLFLCSCVVYYLIRCGVLCCVCVCFFSFIMLLWNRAENLILSSEGPSVHFRSFACDCNVVVNSVGGNNTPSIPWRHVSCQTYQEKANNRTTVNNGYLGLRNDEERSEMRYVMRIAEFSESSNL